MKSLKPHFVFTKQQQRGAFFLILIIVVLQGLIFLIDFHPKPKLSDKQQEQLLLFNKEIDSLKAVREQNKSTFKYNPNYISEYSAYVLNLPTNVVVKIKAYRSKGEYITTLAEFKKVSELPDTTVKRIANLLKFSKNNYKIPPKKSAIAKQVQLTKEDLNKVTIQQLKKFNGIGDKLSARIIKFRTLLGGFLIDNQLYDVYGLDSTIVKTVLKKYTVQTLPKIQKISINNATKAQLATIPYINYKLASKIVNLRNELGGFSSFQELTKIQELPNNKIDRIKLYLTLN